MIEVIKSRLSIRKYSNVNILEDMILKIVETGVKAPNIGSLSNSLKTLEILKSRKQEIQIKYNLTA